MAGRKNNLDQVSSKLCLRCNRILPLEKFPKNKLWEEQLYHDVWCRDCAKRLCKDKEDLKNYCYENNRKWEDRFWGSALKRAQASLNTKPEYLAAAAGEREKKMNAAACSAFIDGMMNLKPFYYYEPHDFFARVRTPENPNGGEPEKPTYSEEWRGYYTSEEIKTLDAIYHQYEVDFVLDNVNIRDYAHKVAKASFNADVAEDRMRRGIGTASAYKEMQKIFDDMSKSSNFAACRRKAGDGSGFGSLGEVIYRLEMDGKLEENGFTFPEDDVDKIIGDFRHTLMSVGLDGAI